MERKKILIAEGDSWFNITWTGRNLSSNTDLVTVLKRNFGYKIHNFAEPKHTLFGMAYNPRQFGEISDHISKMEKMPSAVLFSGGGNDAIIDLPRILIHHVGSMGTNVQFDQAALDSLRYLYIRDFTKWCRKVNDAITRKFPTEDPVPIFIHGYDYPIPDGRYMTVLWKKFGPWLKPRLEAFGYSNLNVNKQFSDKLIDWLNEDVINKACNLMTSSGINVHHLDIRGTLNVGSGQSHVRYWADEIHPNREGYELIAKKFVAAIP